MLVIGLLLSLPGSSWASPGLPHAAGDPTAADNVVITITKDYSLINSQPDIITVNISPTPVSPPGEPITFIISLFTYNPVISTDAAGNAVLSFSSSVAGPVDVTVIRGGVPVGTVTVHFLAAAGPPDPSQSYIAVVSSPATANGVATDVVKAHIVDTYGNPVSGAAVTFSIFTGSASFIGPVTVLTGANGEVSISLISTVAGDVVVQGKVNGAFLGNGSGGNTVTVQFVAGAPDPTKSIISVVTSPATANGTAQDVVKAHIVDANGNPIAGATVTFSIQSGTASFISGQTGTTDANGDLIIPLVSTVAGDVVVQASVNGAFISNGSGGNSVTVKFIADVPDASNSYIAVVSSPATANGTAQDVVKVHLEDKNGNPVGGQFVTFSIFSGTGVFVGSTTLQTGPNGEISIPLVSTVAGDVYVQAKIGSFFLNNNTDGTNSAKVQFVADVPDLSKSYIAVVVSPSPADGSTQDMVKAHLVDANNNPVSNTTVTFNILSGTGTIVGSVTVTTDANGDAMVPIVSTVAGDVSVQGSVGGVFLNDGGGNNFVVVKFIAAAPDPSKSLISVVTSPATADGVAQDAVKVHVVDANGNIVAGATVTFSIQSGTASFVGSVTVITDANGDFTIPLVSTVAGDVVVQAQVGGGFISNGSGGNSVTVQFVAGQAVPSAPGAPNGTGTMLTKVKDSVAANGVMTDIVNAHITDAFGNPVKNTLVTFSIRAGGTATATAALVGTVTLATDANGNITMSVTNTVAGTVWIDATIDYNGNPTSLIDGAYKEMTFLNMPDVDNPATRLIVIVYEALADGTSTTIVKAHVVDQNGNVLPNQEVTFSIDSGSATIITPQPVITDANGDAIISISSTKPGYVLITAVVDGMSIKYGSPARVKFATINIYVPKVFTPNGDGTNDVLKPILVGISNFHYFNIYNRWGNLIFTTQDPNYGWDGTFRGVPQPVETYLWIAEGIDVNGKKIVQKGMVSLVK